MERKKYINNKIIFTSISIFFSMLSLVYKDPWENIYLGVALVALFYVLRLLLTHESLKGFSKRQLVITLIVVIITYVITIFLIFTQRYKIINKDYYLNKQNSQTAVLLVFNGESPMYDVSIELNNIKLRGKTSEMLKSPFVLNRRKKNYQSIGKSQHKENTEQIMSRLQSLLPQDNKVYIGYLYDKKYIEETLIDIVNDGYYKVIVVPMFLTEDSDYFSIKNRINNMKLFNRNIQIRYTEPFWANEKIVKSYLEKINYNIAEGKILDTGIVIIGQGERGNDDSMFIASIKENVLFRKKIKDYLVEILGFPQEKIRLGWDRYMEPNYINEVKKLLEYGVGEILCIYANPQTNFIQNNIILQELNAGVDLPEGVKIKIIDGFLNGYDFIYEVRNRIQIEMLKTWD